MNIKNILKLNLSLNTKVLLALSLTTASMLSLPSMAHAATWYVSNYAAGYNPYGRNGKSWLNAWTDTKKIDWSQIAPGDTILLDAGVAPQPGYTYLSPVAVYSNFSVGKDNVTITVAAPFDPSGTGNIVWIRTQSPYQTAIDIGNRQNVTISGSKWMGSGFQKSPNLAVVGSSGATGGPAGTTGIYVGEGAKNTKLQNIQFQMCDVGLKIDGGSATCRGLRMNNNLTGISYRPGSTGEAVTVEDSWIHNDGMLYANNAASGLAWYARNCNGVSTTGTGGGTGTLNVRGCYLGPGLVTAVDANCAQAGITLANSLINNPSSYAVKVSQATSVSASYLTTFLTPLNSKNLAHSSFSATAPILSISNNIIYGGSVDVTGTNSVGSGNVQFNTTGNTVVISAYQQDPKFTSAVGSVPNSASFNELRDLNFALQPGSPASYVNPTSVASFLNNR